MVPKKNREYSHVCHECGKSYQNPGDLHSHIMGVHEKRFDFQCEKCPKKLPSLKRLNEHMGKSIF